MVPYDQNSLKSHSRSHPLATVLILQERKRHYFHSFTICSALSEQFNLLSIKTQTLVLEI